jgi:hypothetical protein
MIHVFYYVACFFFERFTGGRDPHLNDFSLIPASRCNGGRMAPKMSKLQRWFGLIHNKQIAPKISYVALVRSKTAAPESTCLFAAVK